MTQELENKNKEAVVAHAEHLARSVITFIKSLESAVSERDARLLHA